MANISLPFQVVWGINWDSMCKVKRCHAVWYWLKCSKYGKEENKYELELSKRNLNG